MKKITLTALLAIVGLGAIAVVNGPRRARNAEPNAPAVTSHDSGGDVIDDALLRTGHRGAPRHWPTYGGDLAQTRYSTLAQVDPGNVRRLRLAWIHNTGVSAPNRGYESTPVVVGRALYLTTPEVDSVQYVLRLDAATGEEVWRTPIPQDRPIYCCGANNRGAAVYGGRVYVATLDARLVALDAETGAVEWEVRTAESRDGYSHTQAPIAYGGRVYIGGAGGEHGIRGFLKAYDAESGALVWTWHSIPSPEEGGWWGEWAERAPGLDLPLPRDIRRERADSARYADSWRHGGGAVWMNPAVDAERELLFVQTGNPGPDLDGSVRPGDNRWTSSVCAIRAGDGETAWCFQILPHDVWDYGAATPPILFDLRSAGGKASSDGGTVPAIGVLTKLGMLYVLDRRDGELIRVSENYVPHHGFLSPPTTAGTLVAPGLLGGTAWPPGAYHPGTGYIYTVGIHAPTVLKVDPGKDRKETGSFFLGGSFELAADSVGGARGVVAALDPRTGHIAWTRTTPQPLQSGVLATAGGLVFTGRVEGGLDAWDAATGELLHTFETDAGINAAPATYELDGRQYIVFTAGGSQLFRAQGFDSPAGDAVIALTLP